MKRKSTEPSLSRYSRRHSLRLFHDEVSKESNLNYTADVAESFSDHDYTFPSDLNRMDQSVINQTTASSSFTACAISSCANETSEQSQSTIKKASSSTNKRQNAYFQQKNRTKASEIFRTDLITAMKLGTENLTEDVCMVITDQWKPEWEKGIQVPNEKFISKPNFCSNTSYLDTAELEVDIEEEDETESTSKTFQSDLKQMPAKYLHPVDDQHFDAKIHEPHFLQRITNMQSQNTYENLISISKYDYDLADESWLSEANNHFFNMGLAVLSEKKFEKIIGNFESQSYAMLKSYLDKLCLYQIEYDPTVVCDVCRSPDSDPSNEIVFCDGCNICVHQNCYGIDVLPEGSWLCAACEYRDHFRPDCFLCPNKGGALKPSKDSRKWFHVSCVMWTPEVTFGNTEKYEPVTNISKIPPEKWLLKCSLCKYKKGCCVECSVSRCTKSFHITCAFKHGLLTSEGTTDDGLLEFHGFCKKHSKIKRSQNKSASSSNNNESLNTSEIILADDISISAEEFHLALQAMDEQERKNEIIKRLEILCQKFYHKVSLEKTINDLDMKLYSEQIKFVFNYWKLKRRFNNNKILICVRADKPLKYNQTNLSLKNTTFKELRFRLEYLRNLCFNIKKREKKKEKYNQTNRRLFNKLTEYLDKYKTPQMQSNSKNSNINNKQQPETTFSSCRIRDMMQTKNEKSLYDYPENWNIEKNIKNSLDLNKPFNQLASTINDIESSDSMSQIMDSQETDSKIKKYIKVLNNNTNNQNLQKPTENRSLKLNSNQSKFMIGNCENNLGEKRLLRSFSVISENQKNLQTAENSFIRPSRIKLIEDRPRLSLPCQKTDEVLGSISNDNNTNPTKKLKDEPKKTNITVNNKKRRHNLDYSMNTSLSKRNRPNESILNEPESEQQARFSLRGKSLIEK